MRTAIRREMKAAAATMPMSRLDWVRSAAQEAAPVRAEAAPPDVQASGPERWAAICRAHGLSEEELILQGAGTGQVEQAAIGAGMRGMLEVALEKASLGDTTLAEVERVLEEVREEAPSSSSAHVLVVDDDPVNRLVVKNLLRKSGFRVSEAGNGLLALAELRKADDIAAVVMDLSMPEMGGEELLSRMKSSIATAGIPVVVLTGSEDKGGEARLIDQGADDHIEKPVDPTRFLSRVKATLRRAGA